MVNTNRIRILRTDAKERIISEIEKLGKENSNIECYIKRNINNFIYK